MKIKVYLSFIIVIFSNFCFAQNLENEISNCKIKYEIDTTEVSKKGIIILKITNLESNSLKFSDEFSGMRIQATNLEKFDKESGKFMLVKNSFTDVDCTNCYGKYKSIKPNKSIIYNLDLNKLYLLQKSLKQKNTQYKFNLFFDTIDLLKYSKNRKCYATSFETQKIMYKTQK